MWLTDWNSKLAFLFPETSQPSDSFQELLRISFRDQRRIRGGRKGYIQASYKATITRCDLSPRFFCIDATLLCESESDIKDMNEQVSIES